MGNAGQIILPTVVEPTHYCMICGAPCHGLEHYTRHVVACAREFEGEIEKYRHSKHPEALFGSFDPEYREWQKKTGKLI